MHIRNLIRNHIQIIKTKWIRTYVFSMLTLSLICGTSKSNAVKSLSNWFFIKMISSLTSTNSTSSISSSSSSLTNYQMFSRILKLRIYKKNFFCFVFLQVEFFDWDQKNCEFSQKTHTLCSPFEKILIFFVHSLT